MYSPILVRLKEHKIKCTRIVFEGEHVFIIELRLVGGGGRKCDVYNGVRPVSGGQGINRQICIKCKSDEN
jgi:hypothetical protein